MERGRKMLGALRRGRTSARADSPARTRFARVRRATQRGLLVTAHGELRPVALIILSPAALSPVHVSLCLLLAVARSPSSAFSSSPRPVHANRARRRPPGHSGGPLRSALHQHAARVTPFCPAWEPHGPSASPRPRRRLFPRRRRGRQRARFRVSVPRCLRCRPRLPPFSVTP